MIYSHLIDQRPTGIFHQLRYQVTNALGKKRNSCGRYHFGLPPYLDADLVGSATHSDISRYAAELVSRDRSFAAVAFENLSIMDARCLDLPWYFFVRDVDIHMSLHDARCAFEGKNNLDTHPRELGNSAWPFLKYVRDTLRETLEPLAERGGRVKLRAGYRQLDRKYHGEKAMWMYQDAVHDIAEELRKLGIAEVEVLWDCGGSRAVR